MNSTISRVDAWEALDSRGRPTVACRVTLSDGSEATALSPSGASAGSHEALELRDGGARYAGRGTLSAVENVRGVLSEAVTGIDAGLPRAVDDALAQCDTSPGFSVLGANAVLAVSLAAAMAAAESTSSSLARHLNGQDSPLLLPMPMVNIISGGAHAGGAVDAQDFLVVPVGATSFSEAIEWSVAVRDAATSRALAGGSDAAVLVADEGGLGIPLASNRAALEFLTRCFRDVGLEPGRDLGIAVDVAATEFFHAGSYELRNEGRSLDSAGMIEEIISWCNDFAVVSVEDPLAEDDWDAWATMTSALGDRVALVGDDLFVTQLPRLRRGIESRSANSVLVKVNQNGLVSRAHEVLRTAQEAGFGTVVSARSGDTEDTWLVDLAVGWRSSQIKVGSTHRSERTAKWNRLLQLEAIESTTFAGPWPQKNHVAVQERV